MIIQKMMLEEIENYDSIIFNHLECIHSCTRGSITELSSFTWLYEKRDICLLGGEITDDY